MHTEGSSSLCTMHGLHSSSHRIQHLTLALFQLVFFGSCEISESTQAKNVRGILRSRPIRMDLTWCRLAGVVFFGAIFVYILHQLIKQEIRKRGLFVIGFFSIISYFSLRSFFAAGGEVNIAVVSQQFKLKKSRTASSDLEVADAMASQLSTDEDASLRSQTPKANGPGKTPLATSVLSIAMASISSMLTGCRVEYAMLYGSLLGLIREGKPIDADYDLDLLLPNEAARKALLVCPAFGRPCTRKVKHHCIKQHAPWLWQSTVFVEATPVLIDFYIGLKVGNVMCMCHDKRAFPLRAVYPFRIFEARNRSSFFGPNAPVEITALTYGPDWRIPVRKKNSKRFKIYANAIMPSSVRELYANNCSSDCFPGVA